MRKNPRSIRSRGYDYSLAGAYFVTLCAQAKQRLFGEIVDGRMVFNEYGKVVRDEWERSPRLRSEIELDEYVIMPNHLHGIVIITQDSCGGDPRVAPTQVGATGFEPATT